MERKNKIQRIFDILLTVLVVAAIVIGIVWFCDRFGIISLEEIFENAQPYYSEPSDGYERIEQALDTFENNKESYDRFIVSLDSAKETLAGIVIPETLYWQVQTTNITDGKEQITDIKIYKKADNYRLDITGAQYRTVIHNSGSTYIRNNLTGESRIIKKDSDFSFYDRVNIASLDSLLQSDDNVVSNIYIMNVNNIDCMYVEYKNERLNKNDKYFVSLEFGCVVDASSVLDGENVYKMETINIVRSPEIKDSYFTIPKS